MAAILKDVASKAGVSIQTANQVLTGRGVGYAAATRAKVQAAAKALNYQSNIAGRSLREGKSFLVGILFNGVNFSLMTEFLAGLQQVAVPQSYAPLFLSHSSLEMEKLNADLLRSRRVDGFIVTPWVNEDGTNGVEMYEQIKKLKVPMVEVFSRLLPSVAKANVDNIAAAQLAVRQLAARGHQRIAILTLVDEKAILGLHWNYSDFLRGYETEIKACNLTPIKLHRNLQSDILHPGFVQGLTYEMAPRLMTHPLRPTAIICAGSEEAEGLMHYAARHPELMPPNFEVVAISPGERKILSTFAVNYVQWSPYALGKAAMKSLLALLKKEPVSDVLIEPTWLPATHTNNNHVKVP